MPAGLGGGGWLAICLETVMGTYLPPTTSGTVWVPFLDESLKYTEDAYYSEQIRQQTIDISREQGYYHVEGDVQIEADVNYLPYFLHCSRHNIAKTGSDPYVYTYTASQAGSASTASSGNVARTASITVVRNGVGFGYAGCVMGGFEAMVDSGVLKFTFHVLGLSEAEPAGLGVPSWLPPELFGAASHDVFVDAAGTSPAFSVAGGQNFNGFTANYNYNGAAQNRIKSDRSAAYISYGKTEATYNTELDFLDRTEYDNFKNNTRRAVRFQSLRDGSDFSGSTEAVQLNFYNTAYDTHEVGISGIGELIMAQVTSRGLYQAGGEPYDIKVKSPVDIT